MLNPELLKSFGDDSREFFNEFIKRIGTNSAEMCYAIDDGGITYGDVSAPMWISVYCKDNSQFKHIGRECRNVCSEFQKLSDIDGDDDYVICLRKEFDSSREGIQLWVL